MRATVSTALLMNKSNETFESIDRQMDSKAAVSISDRSTFLTRGIIGEVYGYVRSLLEQSSRLVAMSLGEFLEIVWRVKRQQLFNLLHQFSQNRVSPLLGELI